MASTTTTTMKHRRHVLSEASAILNSNPLRFIAFSVLFLPLTISAASIIQSHLTTSSADVTTFTFKTLIALIPIFLSTFIAISLITHTTLQIIINPKITSLTFKSLLKPLLSTQTIHLFFISLLFTHLSFSLANFITKPLQFRFDVVLVSYVFALCVLLVTFFIFKAVLGSESQPSSFWLYVVFILGASLLCGGSGLNLDGVSKWLLVVRVCAMYMYCSMIVTQFVVGNTVLYVRCKVASGEIIVKSAVDDDRVRSGFFLTMMFLQYVYIGIGFIGVA